MKAVLFQIRNPDSGTLFAAMAVELKDEYSRERQRILELAGSTEKSPKILLSIKLLNLPNWISFQEPSGWVMDCDDHDIAGREFRWIHEWVIENFGTMTDGHILEVKR